MRILMTADPIGGVWQYALELCEALKSRNATMLLATLGAELTPSQRREVARLQHVELRESRYCLEWMDSPWDSLNEAGEWLLALEREFAPDIIHLNHLTHANLPWHAPVLSVGHSCVLSWWAAVRGDEPTGWSRYQHEVSQSLRAATMVCAPTHAMLTVLQQHYGPLTSCEVIPNGRNPRHFYSRTKQQLSIPPSTCFADATRDDNTARSRSTSMLKRSCTSAAGCDATAAVAYGAQKQPFILTAGRTWDAAKNIAALCSVAAEVQWPIYVAGAATGPGGEHQPIQGVHALGPLPATALSNWYSAASIYALPARYEPFGLTALEAALSGCALLLGDIASLREVWGDAAYYVAPDDLVALRKALNELCSDSLLRTRFAKKAQTRAQRYTTDKCAARYWNAYQSLLPAKDTRTCALHSSTIP
jgi:glycogen synthase